MMNQLKETVEYIKSKTKVTPRVAVTLGSGLSSFAKMIEVDATLPYSEIPNFSPPTVTGHPGQLILGHVKGVPIAALQGRIHFYEGHSYEKVIFPTRVMGLLGAQVIILTNAAGGLDPDMAAGQFMIIEDHINLTGSNPLIGKNYEELGPRFPDMTHAYDPELIAVLESILKKNKVNYSKGIYCGVSGPTFETAAEVRYLGKLGGGAVGMSTVPETIAARHMGLKVAGISCVTNLGTGLSGHPLSHEEVKETGLRVETEFCQFLEEFVGSL